MSHPTSFEHPDTVGPYRLLQVIGEGGMGVVYEAEQRRPVQRRVALKMMKVGMDTREVVGRFEAERQALAVMEHPGIAKVFDAGASEQGRSYFVMELVRGVRLDRYCDQQGLTTRQRVELFIHVCEAVQHAHQKGVIHRDLKPGNVLVTHEEHPTPKIIDFGIAKATGQRLTQHTAVTMHGQAVGTLAYMSPEQAEGSGMDVDTRTDVYSLGVVLYEVLTGHVPLDPYELGAPTFLARLIERDHVPPTLPGRFLGLDRTRQDTLARMRRTDIDGLKRDLSGDVQWIVARAMEKDRTRRYATASSLATDLSLYLADEPVSARPPTASYRLRKFVRRNRLGVAAGVALTAAVLLGLVGTSVGLVRARAAESRAEQQTATADLALEFIIGMFTGSDPQEGGSEEVTARQILDASVSRIDTLRSRPLVQARLLQSMGAVYTNLGLFERADTLLRRALDLRRDALDEADEQLERSIRQLAWLYFNEGRMAEALPLAEQALAIAEQAYEPDSPLHADALQVLGMVERELADYEDAHRHLEGSLEIRERVLGPDHIDTGYSLYHLAWLEQRRGTFEKALRIYERILPIFESHYGSGHVATAGLLSDYASALGDDPAMADSALSVYRYVLDVRERAFGPDHISVGHTLNNMGNLYVEGGEPAVAREYYLRALGVYERTEGSPGTTLARLLRNIAIATEDLGDLDAAEGWYLRALDAWERAVGTDHPDYVQTERMLADLRQPAGSGTEPGG